MNRARDPEPYPMETLDPDQIELAGMDSFPASDSPSWIPVYLGCHKPAKQDSSELADTLKENPRADDAEIHQRDDEQSAPPDHARPRAPR